MTTFNHLMFAVVVLSLTAFLTLRNFDKLEWLRRRQEYPYSTWNDSEGTAIARGAFICSVFLTGLVNVIAYGGQ